VARKRPVAGVARVFSGLFLLAATAALAGAERASTTAELAAEVQARGWIAYGARSTSGDWDLFACRPDGSHVRPLTRTPEFNEFLPQFSRDGRRLLYRRVPRAESIDGNRHGEQGELILARVDGAEPVAPGRPGELPWASFSSDGAQLASLSLKGVSFFSLPRREIVRTLPRKGFFQQMTWPTDRRWLVGVANAYGTGWSVARLDAVTGEAAAINRVDCCTPGWFPDSRRVVFSWRPPGQKGNAGQSWTQLWMADAVFNAANPLPLDAWVSVLAYAFQIYFDFAGCSDMAVGLGRMLGFEFPRNFDAPYRAESVTDFWRRWPISLSSVLRDYLCFPLGGNRKGPTRTYVNLAVVMLLGGLWHGAKWNFVFWGACHGLLLAGERWRGKQSLFAALPRPVRVAGTFLLILFTWVLFRADTGQPYADVAAAEVLVLGDSFLRIYGRNEPGAAGFVAHLARELKQPLTSLVSDGGASTLVRQELHRRPALLKNKRVVVWEFVERDLRRGAEGWQPAPLPLVAHSALHDNKLEPARKPGTQHPTASATNGE
jgi:hypothetical protein